MSPIRLQLSQQQHGFTLIELMIAVVVISVLAGVAFPSFMDSIRKGRRSEAFAALSNVQQAQERWRANNSNYSTELTTAAPAGLGIPATTASGYYGLTVSLVTPPASGYIAVATAVSGTSQAKDTNCAKLGVTMNNGNLTYAGTSVSGTLAYAATHPCWSR